MSHWAFDPKPRRVHEMKMAWALILFGLAVSTFARAEQGDVPEVLDPWRGWVLHGEESRLCPAREGARDGDAAARLCAWPGPLALDVSASQAAFRQRWRLYADDWVPLPGSTEHWPVDVDVNGRAALVLDRGGQPMLRLGPGEFEISGRLAWRDRPASLPIPIATALLDLVVDGERVAMPERSAADGRGAVWLGQRPAAVQEAQTLDIRVHRRLADGIPARLETRLLLAVSGPPREVTLGPVLPADYRVLGIGSDLPVRLETGQRLRLQLRRGNWQVVVHARAPGVVESLELPEPSDPWPRRETLSFAPSDSLRIVTLEGLTPTDPAQAGVPGEWQGQAAYVLTPGERLTLIERSRGLAGDAATRLELERELWLGFDNESWIARDRLRGELSGRWRLSMSPPWQLESATSGGQPLSVTAGDDGGSGIELRTARVDVDALALLPVSGGELPASGWQHDLDAASAQLYLPPGHRLVAAFGVDESVGDWVGAWTLLDIFVVLLVTVAAFRLLGLAGAAVALPAVALAYHEPLAPTWLWVNLILAVALVRALPIGRLKQWASVWRAVSFALLLIALLPFAFIQLRVALFPQLGTPVLPALGVPATRGPPSAPPPVAEDAATAMQNVVVTGAASFEGRAKVQQEAVAEASPVLEYLPGTVAQTGPARPQWRYREHRLLFAAPLQPDQTLRLVIAPPWAVSALRVLAVALAVLLLLLLASGVARPGSRRSAGVTGRTATGLAAVAIAAVLPIGAIKAQSAIPTPELLRELERRLLEPPPCAPQCTTLAAASVELQDTQVRIAVELHAAAATAFPLPITGQDTTYQAVVERGAGSVPVLADAGGQAWVLVEPGIRRLDLTLPIDGRAELQIRFPAVPKSIDVRAPAWTVEGIANDRLVGDTLSLRRVMPADEAASADGAGVVAAVQPFVAVERRLLLDLDWSVATRVTRVAPFEAGFSIDVPLLDGESVTDAADGVAIDERTARVSFGTRQGAQAWRSTLQRDGVLELTAPTDRPWTEIWRVAAGPNWHVEFSGTPEVSGPAGDERRFMPRAGETLRIEVTRLEPVAGASLVVDSVTAEHRVATNATATELTYRYRSTQGDRQLLRLPAGSSLEDVIVDGVPVPLRAEQDVVALPVEPGEHGVIVRFKSPTSVSARVATPAIDLGAPAGNVTTRVDLPASRWILATGGSGVGPAVLYWSELVAFVLVALLAGRLPQSPLRTYEWLLLGLGLSTFSWWVLLVFAAWVFAMRWREQSQLTEPLAFNLTQVILGGLTIIALVTLVSAIPNGLLGTPDMRIAGPGSHGTQLSWFDDRVAGELPVKSVLNVSIWWYKAAMLAWALWLSFALVRWVPWAWRAYSAGGHWRDRGRKPRNFQP